MTVTPIHLKEANDFVGRLHRHHKPVVGHKFSLSLRKDDELCGVLIAGRPVARRLDDGFTLEVTRCCTDGTPNACSKLYGAARRIAKEMGYRKIITYILASEPGTTLKAAGWIFAGEAGGGNWNCQSRPRKDTEEHLSGPKTRWECRF